jgi:hypothetical protein
VPVLGPVQILPDLSADAVLPAGIPKKRAVVNAGIRDNLFFIKVFCILRFP